MRRKAFTLLSLIFIAWHIPAEINHPIWVNIVYIGNSITQGVLIDNPRKNAPPVKASVFLHQQPEIGEVKFSNQGVSGSTTVDFLPESNTLFPRVIEAADKLKEDTWATLVFSIMLGTNDSAIEGPNGAPVSPDTYYRNMKTIIDELFTLYPGCLIVLNRPLWYSPTTHNASRYLEEGLDRLQSYFTQLELLVSGYQVTHPGQVYAGDKDGFTYFKENHETLFLPEEGQSGIFYLHPNEQGTAELGKLWGKAIYNALISKSRRDDL